MSGWIIHVGADAWHRVSVLESAGHRAAECHTLADLRKVLASNPKPDAVIVTQDEGRFFRQAIALVRTHPEIPVILFGEPQESLAQSRVDLVIPFLAMPDAWLAEVAALIADRRAACMGAKDLSADAATSRRQPQRDAEQSAQGKRSA